MNNFLKITSNDNWFKQHPEKIAGVEYETTSFYFPIMVKGTKEDVLRVTGMSEDKLQTNILSKSKQEFINEMVLDFEVFGSFPTEIKENLKIVSVYYSFDGKSKNEFSTVKPTKSKVEYYAGIVYDYLQKKSVAVPEHSGTDKIKRIRLAKAKAKALKVKLSLGQLGVSDNKSVRQRIKELVIFAFENINTSKNKREPINEISEKEANFLKEKTGFDFSGYERIIDKSSVIHTFNQHGNQKSEAARGQIAITKKDFELIPEIVKSKNVINTEKNKNGAECIMYEAIIGDTFYYVEEIRKGKKKLCLKTMYKRKTNYTE